MINKNVKYNKFVNKVPICSASMNEETAIDHRKPYFKEQFLCAVENLEREEILRRARARKTKEMLKQKEGPYAELHQYAVEYSYETDIHGVMYLIERRSACEKVFWAFVVCTAIILCILSVSMELVDFYNRSIIKIIRWHDTPLFEIEFPAVTICSKTNLIKDSSNWAKLEEFHAGNKTPPKHLWVAVQYWNQLCHLDKDLKYGKKFLTQEEFFYFVDQVRVPIHDVFLSCELFGTMYNCSDLFFPTITENGICYTFNSIHRQDLFKKNVFLHDDFFQNKPLKSHIYKSYNNHSRSYKLYSYPERALLAGTENDLRITLKSIKYSKRSTVCKTLINGYSVNLHSSISIPRPSRHYFVVPVNKYVSVAMEPVVLTTHKKILNRPYSTRQCYLYQEKELKHFNTYDAENCYLQCLTNLMLEKCSCVQFFMPRWKNTPICGSKSATCVKDVDGTLEQLEIESNFKYCDCKPLCTEVKYEFHTSQNNWDWQNYYQTMWGADIGEERIKINTLNETLSMLSIYFKSPYFRAVKRYEGREIVDLVSSLGGFLSFFTGISIVSVLEIIYFFSLRICCNRIVYGAWSGPKSKI